MNRDKNSIVEVASVRAKPAPGRRLAHPKPRVRFAYPGYAGYLCWAFVEAANFAIRFNPLVARWYDRKRARKHRIVAVKAVAHKLARAAYHVMHDHTPFDAKTRVRLSPATAAGRYRGLA